jgi:adenylate cyclase
MNKPHIRNRTILVIDDEVLNLQLLKELLTIEGYAVVCISNSEEAAAKVKEINPDVILLDVVMPKINGYQVCTLIRSDASIPYIPIIFLTATEINNENIIHGLDIGGDDYIAKPFHHYELLSRIRANLRIKDLYDELAKTKTELSRYVSRATSLLVEKAVTGEVITPVENVEVTALFSDMRGFTTIAEQMDCAEVFEKLNYSLSTQIKVIEEYHGIIDKLSGDEIMTVFHGEGMAEHAVACARAIISSLCDGNSHSGNDWVGIGIGIHSGRAYMGTLGSETRKHHTVVGTTVNIAARLCGHAKKFQILFSADTEKLIRGRGFNYQSAGNLTLKGLRAPIEAFELS